MDVKALSPDVIKKKILDVALSMTGADDGDIEAHCCHVLFFTEWLAGGTVFFKADTPLMEAGLTSTSAVGLPAKLRPTSCCTDESSRAVFEASGRAHEGSGWRQFAGDTGL